MSEIGPKTSMKRKYFFKRRPDGVILHTEILDRSQFSESELNDFLNKITKSVAAQNGMLTREEIWFEWYPEDEPAIIRNCQMLEQSKEIEKKAVYTFRDRNTDRILHTEAIELGMTTEDFDNKISSILDYIIYNIPGIARKDIYRKRVVEGVISEAISGDEQSEEMGHETKLIYFDSALRLCKFVFKEKDLDLMVTLYDKILQKKGEVNLMDIAEIRTDNDEMYRKLI